MKTTFALFFFTLLIVPIRTQAQSNETVSSQQTSKSFVSVPVTVSDRENRYVPNLKKEDFSVFQDGIKQKITFFSTYNEPLKIVLLLDTSKSTRNVIGKIKDAAKDFVDTLKPNDECQVATFDSRLKVINSFTSNHQLIKDSLNRVEINKSGGTLMFSAVNQIIQKSFNNVKNRKVIILLTDGNDFGSSITKKDFLNLLEESDILIYTIFFRTGENIDQKHNAGKEAKPDKKARKNKKNDPNAAQAVYTPTADEIRKLERREEGEAVDSLQKMSDITAGRFYQSSIPDLKKVFKNITGELTQQYRLGFDSRNSANNGDVHNISVKVERPDAIVRSRGVFRTRKQ
ncbi:MAG: VWA domain-containing protein [Pyrinomonadaceae bacterium]